MFLLIALQWLSPVLMLMALFASLRYSRVAKSSPLLSGGLALVLTVNFLSRVHSTLGPLALHITPYSLLSVVISLAGIVGWGLIAYGLYSILEEVSAKLALLQLTPQNSWNYQAAPNLLQSQRVQARQDQKQQIQEQHDQTPQYQEGQETILEEIYTGAFASPALPASSIAPLLLESENRVESRPVFAVQPEQPDTPLTLGSTRQ